ncbi:MAG: tetratricopeptide repeat protein [Solobacterium sp.]|nr:tetratricopeptide repeat protein [Solobacterium sp.]
MKQPEHQKWDNPGNEVIRRTENNFQGRLDEIRIFHERTNWLQNHMHEDSLITNYYGFGGIGKTWLLRRLNREAKNRNVKYISFEFGDSASAADPSVVILYLASAINKVYGGHVWDRTYDLLKQYGADPSVLEKEFGKFTKLYDAGAGLVDTSLTIAAIFNPEAAVLKTLGDLNKNYKTIKSLRKNSMTIGEQFGGKDSVNSRPFSNEETLADELADAFAADLQILLEEQNKPLIIALDGLDRFYRYASDDEWLKLMIRKTNDIHWILAGRDALTWDDEIWKMQVEKGVPHLLPVAVSALSKEETNAYFVKAEVSDKDEFLDYLYQLIDGIPLYMYLCVDIYVDLINRGIEPAKDTFQIEVSTDDRHKHHTKLIQRWAEDHPDEIRELAAAYKWNDEVLKDRHISISPATKDWYALSKEKSIFQYDQKGNCSFHDVIQEVLMDDALNKGMYGFMNHMQDNATYYMDAVKNDGNSTVTDTGIDVLLYYLSLENESWYNTDINRFSILNCLSVYCNSFDITGNWQYQLELSGRILAIVEDNPRFTDDESGRICFAFANACANMVDYSKALVYYQKALNTIEEMPDPDYRAISVMYNNYSLVYLELGDYPKAKENLLKALEYSEKIPEKDYHSLTTIYNSFGSLYRLSADYDKALESYDKAFDFCKKDPYRNDKDLLTIQANLAGIFQELGDYGRAYACYAEAWNINQNMLKRTDLTSAFILGGLGDSYKEWGDYNRALACSQESLRITEQFLGTDHQLTALRYNHLGDVYRMIGEYPSAIENVQNAIRVFEKDPAASHQELASAYQNLAGIYTDIGDLDQAFKYARKSVEISESVMGSEHMQTALAYECLGIVYMMAGEYETAKNHLVMAQNICEKTLGAKHPRTARIRNNLGAVFYRRGDYQSAANTFFKAYIALEEMVGYGAAMTQATGQNLLQALSDYFSKGGSLDDLDEELIDWYKYQLKHNGGE